MAKRKCAQASFSSTSNGKQRKRLKVNSKGKNINQTCSPAASETAPITPRASFLGLPREVRNMIYAYSGIPKSRGAKMFYAPKFQKGWRIALTFPQDLTPALTLVNKQVYDEYSEEYRRNPRVDITWEGSPPCTLSGFKHPFSGLTAILRGLKCCTIVPSPPDGWWDKPEQRQRRDLTHILDSVTSYMTELKDLTINVPLWRFLYQPDLAPQLTLRPPHERSNALAFLRFHPPDPTDPLRNRPLDRLERAIEIKYRRGWQPPGLLFRRVEDFTEDDREPKITDWQHPRFAEVLAHLRWEIKPAHKTFSID